MGSQGPVGHWVWMDNGITCIHSIRGVILGGLGGGGLWPPNFWPTTLFSGFSHTTDRKVPSEVVLMGFLCQSYMVMSDETAIF